MREKNTDILAKQLLSCYMIWYRQEEYNTLYILLNKSTVNALISWILYFTNSNYIIIFTCILESYISNLFMSFLQFTICIFIGALDIKILV